MLKDNYIYSYYQQIKDGSVVVGKWIKLIYEYIINGLEDKRFIFDQKKANHAIEWMEAHCFHTEGFLAPNPIKFELWQKAFISCMFGIADAETGKRQFREVLLVIGRKNGKTLFASCLAKYVWYIDGGFGSRVYCTAPTLPQADLVYDSVWLMTQLDPEWQAMKEEIEASKDEHNKKTIDDGMLARHTQNALKIKAINAEVKKIAQREKTSNGFNPSLVICDEIASWEGDKGLKHYSVMKSGMGTREMGDNPPILLSCSTSGYINDGIFDELMKRSTRFLMGESKETRLLPFLYMIDDVDRWNDLNELRKANPNLGVSTSIDFMLESIAVAEGSLAEKAEFLTKYCNIKQNSSSAWLSFTDVEKANGEELDIENFRGCYCFGGIDLSQTTDLTSCNLVFMRDGHFYIFSKFFLPSERIDEATERDGLPYRQYIEQGFLKPSGENFVDYNDCFEFFQRMLDEYEVYPLMIGYDRYSANYLIKQLNGYGFHTDDVFQGNQLYPIIRNFEGLLKDGKIHIGNNNLLKVHLLNCALKMDTELNRGKLVKIHPNDHIDGAVAVIDAFTVYDKYIDQYGEMWSNE